MKNPEVPAEMAPLFEAQDTHGRLVRLSDLRGRIVVLAFLRGFS